MSQTDVTMFLDGVQVRDGRMPEPYWYAEHTLKICVDGIVFQLGTAKGDDHNCLIDTLRQMLNERHGALIVEGSVADVRARLEDRHRGGATPIASLDFLDLADHWEDIVDLLEGADEGRSVRPLGSAHYEVMCVDLMYVGSGDRLPRRRDRGGRKTLYIARVNGNHFVPLKWVSNPRSLRPEPPAPPPWGGAPAAAALDAGALPEASAAPATSPGAAQAGAGSAGRGIGAPAGWPAEGRSASVPASDGAAADAPAEGGDGAGGAGAATAASEPSSGGERGGLGRRASARESAAAAAEERARQEDPAERERRLAIAEHNKRQELEGKVIGALRARQENVPFDIGRWSHERLRQTLRRLRGGGDGDECEPTIAALSDAAL